MSNSRSVRFRNEMLAAWKWCLSFRKSDWRLNDYPIATREQEPNPAYSAPRFTQHHYRAYIIRWPVISGSGDTPQQARANLEQMFEKVIRNQLQEGRTANRPGTKVRIEFASQEKVSSDPALSDDFIQRVLGLEGAWISDESSLWDFHSEQTNDHLYAKIREVYGVDVSDIESASLWAIFESIEESRDRSTPELPT